jgi:hypothetical protein
MNSLADAVKATGTLGVVRVFVPENPDAEDGRWMESLGRAAPRPRYPHQRRTTNLSRVIHGTATVRMKLVATRHGYRTSHGLVQVWGRKLLACIGDWVKNSAWDQDKTPDYQPNAKGDHFITQQVRKADIDDKDLSTYAHNVKIITVNGAVTPRFRPGPTARGEGRGRRGARARSLDSKAVRSERRFTSFLWSLPSLVRRAAHLQ